MTEFIIRSSINDTIICLEAKCGYDAVIRYRQECNLFKMPKDSFIEFKNQEEKTDLAWTRYQYLT